MCETVVETTLRPRFELKYRSSPPDGRPVFNGCVAGEEAQRFCLILSGHGFNNQVSDINTKSLLSNWSSSVMWFNNLFLPSIFQMTIDIKVGHVLDSCMPVVLFKSFPDCEMQVGCTLLADKFGLMPDYKKTVDSFDLEHFDY